MFKDLSALELTENWFEIKGDLQFTYDLIASLLLFYLIFLFQKQGKIKSIQEVNIKPFIEKFVNKKKLIAVILVPLFFFMALYTLLLIGLLAFQLSPMIYLTFQSINNLFFDKFFTALILVDVFYFYYHSFTPINSIKSLEILDLLFLPF